MRTKVILTDRAIAALKPAAAGRRYIIQDINVPGLGVRVTDRNHRSFILGMRAPGSTHYVRREIGEVGAITLADARTRAREWLLLIKQGIDPATAARQARAAIVTDAHATFGHVAEEFIKRHLKDQRTGARVAREIRNELISQWGALPVSAISRQMVVELIEKIVDRPGAA